MVAASGGHGLSAQSPVVEVRCLGAAMKGRDKGKRRLIHVMSILAILAVNMVAVVGAVLVSAQHLVEVVRKRGLVLKEDIAAGQNNAAVTGGIVQRHHHRQRDGHQVEHHANGLNGANVQ